ncbi:MAG: hypothetical protein Q9226_008838, partial [Calogaya cf. arnoldii]
ESRNSLGKPRSTSRSPVDRGPKARRRPSVDGYGEKPSPSPKRGRGRPRNSVDKPGVSSSVQSQEKNASQSQASSELDQRQGSPCTVSANHSNDLTQTQRESSILEDQHEEFDSIIESEGFSMVSVSSLPSARGSSGMTSGSKRLPKSSPFFSSRRHVTPSDSDHSPPPPPPPKVGTVQQSTRELQKPTSGTPRLARVVRAGIALQGVLSPARQRHTSATLAPWLNHSSPMSSTTSPKERLDELFNGFGPGTCRELRAGLRLGEELAKRQTPEANRSGLEANEDVFAPDSEVRYPQLSASENYSLTIPDAARTSSPSFSNPQLPSPARSEAAADDDRMSWRFDTIQSNPVQTNIAKRYTTVADDLEAKSSPVNQTMLEREAQYQREREAISKQIDEANSSQVIVVNSDEEDEALVEPTSEDDGDIWQEEAQINGSRPSTSDIPPIFLQNQPRKPRRSQLPSPWMRKTQDLRSSSPAPNDSDLFWQPSHAKVPCETREIPKPKSAVHSSSSNSSISRLSALTADGASDDVDDHSSPKGLKAAVQASLPSPTSEEEAHVEKTLARQKRQTILDQIFDHSDSEDSTYEAEDSDDSLTDDEDIESTVLGHHFMQEDDITSLLDEARQFVSPDVITPTSSKTSVSEEVPEPRTPSCLARTPKGSSSKKVRFTTETKTSDSLTETSAPPLPPAPSSWFGRVTSLLPTWTTTSSTSTTSAAAIPLPTKPKKVIILPRVDVGPLPAYMPWQPSHWWALIHIIRQISATPAAYPYDAKSLSATWLGCVVTVKKWKKTITKTDCTTVECFMRALRKRGTFKGVEETTLN